MYKNLIIFLTTFLVFSCQKKELVLFEKPITETTYSTELQREVEYIVYLPKNYSNTKKYPTVYLLDGHYFLESGLIKNIATLTNDAFEEGKIPEVILVGIANDKNRRLDYTYLQDPKNPEITGKGEDFYRFLKNELITLIDEEYTTQPDKRILIGQSLGGLFTLSTLFMNEANPFSGLISSTPALNYSDGLIIQDELANTGFTGKLFLTVGGEEASLVILSKVMVEKLKNNSFLMEYKIYPKETHRSVALTSFEDGLFYMFN